ncbi:monofunctional biosynthetic peptidoglycan transglycosylase [Siphonobacter sp.]|uniref:monofunctional biosynthetic peptidoglycan transglycosylase n=1 Tax=Siphonobacter sp. TaxID=1869184 RepID=UPI003B3B3154
MPASKSPDTYRSWPQQVLRFFGKILFYFIVLSIGGTLVFRFVPIPITWTMLDRKITNGGKLYYDWTSYDEISPEMALAVVASEDQRFPQHFGFDFEMMGSAFKNNLKGRRIKGASTISQQVAKNVFLWQGRSYFRKMLEAWFTLLIEVIWGKQRILEVYLNVAETGPMTFGVEAAAQRYYGKPAAQLTRTEAARIAAVLPSPNRFLIARPSSYVQRRTNSISRQMRALGGKSYLIF